MCQELSSGEGIAVNKTEAPWLSGVNVLLGATGALLPTFPSLPNPDCYLILGVGGTGLSRWLDSKEPACQWQKHKTCGFDPGVGKIPWRRVAPKGQRISFQLARADGWPGLGGDRRPLPLPPRAPGREGLLGRHTEGPQK